MQKRILSITITALLFFSLLNSGCTKLDTTDIGSDLLPAVDNVNTFDTLININTTQGVFNPDTTIIYSSDDHVLGKISNDPLFGTTVANVYAQFKPTFYPYYYGNAKDTINNSLAAGTGFDSVVLCLSYKGFWGDSTLPLNLEVRQVPVNAGGLWDSLYQSRNINYAPSTSNILGSITVDIAALSKYVVYSNKKDSVKNQIRIKLTNTAFINSLYNRDSLVTGNNTFRSDSLFRAFQNGLAIIANGGGNVLLYTNLTDSSSKLEVHFRRKNGGAIDTTYSSFKINAATTPSANAPSATANNIIRNRSGYPVASPAANEIYLQTTPGTYANLSIPDLATVSNRIIHRAEIIIEQMPDLTSARLTPPNFLYLDLKDTGTTNKWKPIYLDLNPTVSYLPDNKDFFYPSAGIDYAYHGGFVRDKKDQFGNAIKYYNFNITRYVQQIVTKHTTNYQMRLYAPYIVEYPQYIGSFENGQRAGNNRIASGRVKVGGGSNTNYRMRLRLVYSKI